MVLARIMITVAMKQMVRHNHYGEDDHRQHDEDGSDDSTTMMMNMLTAKKTVRGDKEPIYEETMEDLGRANELPVLPFNAFGTMAMARTEFEPNSASSQVFWLLKESELTPTGSNLLDGRYSVFGYITKNEDALGDLQVGDVIESVKVVDGLEYLQQPRGGAEEAAPPIAAASP